MERTFLLDNLSREEPLNLSKYRCPMCLKVLPSEIDPSDEFGPCIHSKRLQEDNFEIQREIQREIQDYVAILRHTICVCVSKIHTQALSLKVYIIF